MLLGNCIAILYRVSKNHPGFEDNEHKRMLLSHETLLGIRITSEYVATQLQQ